MIPVRSVRSKGILQNTYCNSGVDGRWSPGTALRWRMSRHTSVATIPRLTRPTKGEQKGNRFRPTRLVTLATDGMDDTAEDDDAPEKAPIVRPAKFGVMYEYDSMEGLFPIKTLSRLIYPYDVENQKESVICQGGDYTYMRNTEPITDEQPNFPSAMFLAKEDRSKAEAEYTDAIYTIGKTNEVYREEFRHGSLLNPIPTISRPRGVTLGFCEYDFVGASMTGKEPPLLPLMPGRGGYETDGAMFASRIVGSRGGLVSVYPPPEITIARYQPDNTSKAQKAASPADRLAALRWTVKEVMSSADMDVVAIVYDPNEPFTGEELACIVELLDPKACAVVFLVPKDEPVDMEKDLRYAVMYGLQEEGALVVSSVDGDYLRTPLAKAGWGMFDYNVVVGDTEAPGRGSKEKYQLAEGTSVTAAAAGCAACIAVLLVLRPRRATPCIVKQILSEAAIDLNQVLTPKTIADLEAYRDQCIADCGLSAQESSPQYQSMLNGLAIDARILRFNKKELVSASKRVFADALVALADVAASTVAQLAPEERLQLTLEQTRTIANLKFDITPDLGVSDADFRAWAKLIEAAGNQKEYSELAETAGTLAGLIPLQNVGFCVTEFATAICEARKIITARGPVREDMQWVLGVSEDTASPVRDGEIPRSLGGNGVAGSEDLENLRKKINKQVKNFKQQFDRQVEDFRKQLERQVEEQSIRAAEEIEEFRKRLQRELEKQGSMDTSSETVQEGQPDAVEGSEGDEVPDEVQGPPNSDLAAGEQFGAPAREGPGAGEAELLATNELLAGESERSWAGLLQYLVDLLTGKQGGKEGQGKQEDTDEDGRLSKMKGAGNKRTWVGLIEYFSDLLKKAFNI